MSIADTLKITMLYQGAANAVACDIVNTEDFHSGAFLICHVGANDTDLTLSLYEATTAGGSTAQAVTKTCPIWIDSDAGASSDVLARTTDAYSIVIDPATQNGVVAVMEIDPAILSDGYPYVYLADSGGNSGNTVSIFWLGQPRYSGATLPTALA